MIASILAIIGAILSIVEINLRRKYLDQYLNLQRAYHEAINKPPQEWDDAVIDNIEFELRVLARAISSDVALMNANKTTT
jgi:hypothetical protein